MSKYRSKWLEIYTLYQMGIAFFLNRENSWHNESPQALSFWERGKIPRNARNIGVKHEDDPCTYIGKVLRKFGLRTRELKQKSRPDGTRYREYSIREMDLLSQAVYECVEVRLKNQVSEFNFDWKKIVKNSGFKTAETPVHQSLQPAHLQPDNYIEARVEVCRVPAVNYPEEKPEESITAVDSLVEILKFCDNESDVAEVAKYYDAPNLDGSQRSPGQKEDLVEAALLFSSLDVRHQLQRWWDSVVWQVRDFWRELESAPGVATS
jgi:hypothetical protein